MAGMLSGLAVTLAITNSPEAVMTSMVTSPGDFPDLTRALAPTGPLAEEHDAPVESEEVQNGTSLDEIWNVEHRPLFETLEGRDPSATPTTPTRVEEPRLPAALDVTKVTGATEDSVRQPLADEVASWSEADWNAAKLLGEPLSERELNESKEEFWARRMGEFSKSEQSSQQTGRPPCEPTLDDVAKRHGYSTEFFSYMFGNHPIDLGQLASVELREDPGARPGRMPRSLERACQAMPHSRSEKEGITHAGVCE